MKVISTRELSKSFRHSHAVEKLNLEIPEGSIYALVGPNGAGKTTAIKTLMNILRPSAGSAEVPGIDSRRLGPAEFSQIGYVRKTMISSHDLAEIETFASHIGYLDGGCLRFSEEIVFGLGALP